MFLNTYSVFVGKYFFDQMKNSCCPLRSCRQSDCELYIFLPYCPERKTSIGINPRKAINPTSQERKCKNPFSAKMAQQKASLALFKFDKNIVEETAATIIRSVGHSLHQRCFIHIQQALSAAGSHFL